MDDPALSVGQVKGKWVWAVKGREWAWSAANVQDYFYAKKIQQGFKFVRAEVKSSSPAWLP